MELEKILTIIAVVDSIIFTFVSYILVGQYGQRRAGGEKILSSLRSLSPKASRILKILFFFVVATGVISIIGLIKLGVLF